MNKSNIKSKLTGTRSLEGTVSKRKPKVMKKITNANSKRPQTSGNDGATEKNEPRHKLKPRTTPSSAGTAGSKKSESDVSAGTIASEETRLKLLKLTRAVAELETEKKLLERGLEAEKKSRNYFEIERDKMQQFWEITRQQLDIQKQNLWKTEHTAEKTRAAHVQEVLDLQQRIRLMMMRNEKSTKARECQTDNEAQSAESESQENQLERMASAAISKLKADLATQTSRDEEDPEKVSQFQDSKGNNGTSVAHRLTHEYMMLQEKDREISRLRTTLQKQAEEIRNKLTAEHQKEMEEFKLVKQKQFDEILSRHQKDLTEIQEKFDQQILHERHLLEETKAQSTTAATDSTKLYEELTQTKEKYENLFQLYKAAETRQHENQLQIEKLQKQNQGHEATKREAKAAKKNLGDLEQKHEILWTEFKKLEKERDNLFKEFRSSVRLIQDQAEVKNAALNRQLSNAEKLLQNLSRN